MQEIYNWESIESFFSALNDNVDYIVLRNFEGLVEGRLFNEVHPDIDVLCKDVEKLLFYAKVGDNINQKKIGRQQIKIDGRFVRLDVRFVGDGYYDKQWEDEMLTRRRLIKGLCYVPDETDYLFSLIYHALVQKNKLSEDYEFRIKQIASNLGKSLSDPLSTKELEVYMRSKGYKYTYPSDLGVITNFSGIDKKLVEYDVRAVARRRLRAFRNSLIKLLK